METYKKKTKMELQMSVKQLKDENEVYSRMNKELSQKLQEVGVVYVWSHDYHMFLVDRAKS